MLEALREQREESRALCERLERNKSSVDTIDMEIDRISKTLKSLREESGRLREQVNSWEVELREMEKKCDFMGECRRRSHILIFGIEECSRETYFETLKISGHFRIEIESGCVKLSY